MSVLPAFITLHYVLVVFSEARDGFGSPGTGVRVALSCCVSADDRAQVFCKSGRDTQINPEPSLQPLNMLSTFAFSALS